MFFLCLTNGAGDIAPAFITFGGFESASTPENKDNAATGNEQDNILRHPNMFGTKKGYSTV